MASIHKPVMLEEIIRYLQPKKGDLFVDCTLGGGGYSLALAKAVGKTGKVLGIDLDAEAIARVEKKKKELKIDNLILEQGNFRDLKEIVSRHFPNKQKFNGIVFDLGLSSDQLADQSRAFSFSSPGQLDMSFGPESDFNNTRDIINRWSSQRLEEVIKDFSQERFAKRIVQAILTKRRQSRIETAVQLAEIISEAVPKKFWPRNIHVATKTFQALRIATNEELKNIEIVLPQTVDLLISQGRLAVVSFHSLEDRIIKNYFRNETRDCICPPAAPSCICGHKASLKILIKKGLIASEEEIKVNPRSRSARLRLVEKI